MKKILLISAGLLLALSLSAQKIELGVRAGLNLSKQQPTETKGGLRPGVNAGLIADIKIGGNFFLQPGLLYSLKTSRYIFDAHVADAKSFYDTRFSHHYLEMPVSLGYSVHL